MGQYTSQISGSASGQPILTKLDEIIVSYK